MLLLRVNKQIIKTAAISMLLVLIMSVSAFADTAEMWYGEIKKGDIASRTSAAGTLEIAADEAVTALGLARVPDLQGVIVTYDGKKLEFWSGSSVVRVSGAIVSIPGTISASDGHWWIDAKSLALVLDKFYVSIGKESGMAFGAKPNTAAAKETKKETSVKKEESAKSDTAVRKEEPAKKTEPEISKPEVSTPDPAPAPAEQTETALKTVKPAQVFTGSKRPIAVLDAGHGGHDPGASANGVVEKNVNLKAVLILGEILREYGMDVRYSRHTDVYLKLAQRTAFANDCKADIFISLHCNAMPKGSKRVAGVEFYIMALPSDKDAMRLAIYENKEISGGDSEAAAKKADQKTQLLLKILGDMQQNDKISASTNLTEVLHKTAKSSGLPMRKVGQAPFFVLRGAGMPAVLIEMGYLTDPAEARKLSSQSYLYSLCSSFASGIVTYVKEHPVVAD